jgi:hypothetical protein
MAKPFPRAGAWAVLADKVGVIHQYPQVTVSYDPDTKERLETVDPSSAEVHFTNDVGETVEEARGVPVDALAQATFEQIPAARRPSPELAQALGYVVTE